MELNVEARSVNVDTYRGKLTLAIEGVAARDLAEVWLLKEILPYLETKDVLDLLDKNEIRQYIDKEE